MDIKEKDGVLILGEHRFKKSWLKSERLQQVLRDCASKPKDVVTQAWNHANGVKAPKKSSTKSKSESSKKSHKKD